MDDLQIGAWADNFASGLWVTIYFTVISAVTSMVVAVILGLMARAENIVPRGIARVIIEFFRGTSLLVQLFWIFYVLPQLGLALVPLAAGIVAFTLNFGAYGAEVVRGAINAVPKPQWEGAIALNLSPFKRMVRVIMPQALPLMIPPFNNLLIQLLKSTPLVFLVTVQDLTFWGDQYRSSVGNEAFIFPVLLVLYFILSYIFTLFMQLLERRAKTRLGQGEARKTLFSFRGPQEEEGVRA